MADIDILGKIKVILEKGGLSELDRQVKDLDKSLAKTERGLDKVEAASRKAAAGAAEGATGASKFSASLEQVQRRLLGFGALIQIFRFVKSSIEDATAATAEGRAELGKMSAQWEMIRGRVGELGSRALPLINTALDYAVRVVQTIGAAWGGFLATAIEGAKGFGKTIAAAFDFKTLFTDGPRAFFQAIGDEAARGMESVKFAFEGGVEEGVAIWKRGLDEIKAEQTEFARAVEGEILTAQIEAAKQNIAERLRLQLEALDVERRARVAAAEKANEDVARVEELYRLRAQNLEADAAADLAKIKAKQLKEAEDAAKQAAEESKRLEDERLKFAQDAEDRLLKAKIDAAKAGTEERLALEIEMLARVRDRAIAEAQRIGLETAAIEEAFRLSAEALRDDYAAERSEKDAKAAQERQKQALEAALGLLEAQAALEDEFSAQRLELQAEADAARMEEELKRVEGNEKALADIRERYRLLGIKREKDAAEARKTIAEEEKRAKIEATLQVAQMAVGAAQAIFGENKALAIASTIISTIAAVMKALEIYGPTPLGYAAAAIAAATGAAQIAKIRSTNLGAGGAGGGGGVTGAPVATAAPQPVETFTSGRPTSGVPVGGPGAAPGATGADRGATVIFEGPAFIDRAGFRRLSRELDRVRQRDRSRVQR